MTSDNKSVSDKLVNNVTVLKPNKREPMVNSTSVKLWLDYNNDNGSEVIDDPILDIGVSGNSSDDVCVSCSSVGRLFVVSKGTPDWQSVQTDIRWIFLLHAYGFACSFFILAFYSFFSILNIRSLITSRPFMSTINMFICFLGVSRAGSLFIDPYHLKDIMPMILGNIIWDVGYPSIIAAFSLVQLAFLQLTQLRFGPELLRNKSCLSLIITAHFTCVMKYVTQTVFLLWGSILCCTFIYAGYRVRTLINNMPSSLLQRDFGDTNCKGIMQLAMLAPYNNLASSVAAALVPTLLGPKFGLANMEPPAEPSPSSSSISKLRPSLQKTSKNLKPNEGDTAGAKTNYSRIPTSPSSSRQEVSRTASTISTDSVTSNETPKLKKNLSWGTEERSNQDSLDKAKLGAKKKKPTVTEVEERKSSEATLLPQEPGTNLAGAGPDLTLHAILNHIAYVNRAAAHSDSGLAHGEHQATPASRKKQVMRVLRITYLTAFIGLLLCLSDLFRLYGPYGLHSQANIKPWPWFCFETICRAMELVMGCAMANITKQPTPRHRYLHQPYGHTIRVKQRESLFM
ncbi:hypothetical protein LSTR_LSTR012059 [Laodelphax striatellus]|uniref:Proline-rich transmembrane protein 3/4 domain-containing protein n=1 Tax=Laodelphax striatellus TaxID=195883 RepID=A0A482WRF2_LAOST|nr:hypothetical protein LSTR_LSTR012059 [Laodelphax striatellus]